MSWTLDASTPTLDSASTVATLDGSGNSSFALGIFYWSHSYASPRKTQIDVNRAPFGDGYEQRVGRGINNIKRTWDLNFNGREEIEAQEIVDFLEARREGQSFDWVPEYLNPTSQTIKVYCLAFDVNPSTYKGFNISATFREVFGE